MYCCRRRKWWWCLQTTTPPLCCWSPAWSRSVSSSPRSTCLWQEKQCRSDIRESSQEELLTERVAWRRQEGAAYSIVKKRSIHLQRCK
jgi:hypothetical protein